MKNFNLFTLLVIFTIVFSSCSTNETAISEAQPIALLKTYTISRDANGAYSLAYDLNGDATTETIVDESTNTNKVFLYSSNEQTSRKATQNLVINGSELKVGFVDTSSDELPEITITDDNIKLAKDSNDKLKEYSIKSNEDGTYNLDFTVNSKVKVDFVFNEDIDTYEIHLEEGKGADKEFSRVLVKEADKPLKFDFVNHIITTTTSSAKSEANKTAAGISMIRKPQGIIL